MRKLLSGKKKFLPIPLAVIFGLALLPFTIGIGLGYLAFRKIGNQRLRYAALAIIGLFTLFTGSAW